MNPARINRKIERIYESPNENIYSHRFYSDLFSGYAYSLNEDKINRKDFYKITPNDNEIVKLFRDCNRYDFSYKFGQTVDRILYSMAAYGKAFVFIRPEYEGESNKKISALHISEVKGIQKRNIFYCRSLENEISEFNISKGSLITFDLKELGYKRNFFAKLIKQLGQYDTAAMSVELINKEPTYDFNVHLNENRKRFLRHVRKIGWRFGTDEFSDSYILYKEIRMKLFKLKMLRYVLGKINRVLAEEYITNREFKIEALTGDIDYEDVWVKFQNGEFTVSELSDIIWKGINV